MSFLSDIGALIGQYQEVVDELKQTVTDSAQEIVSTGVDLKGTVNEGLVETMNNVASAREGFLGDVGDIKTALADKAKNALSDVGRELEK